MSDDGLDRMWGDSPDRSENDNQSSSPQRERPQRSRNGDWGQRHQQPGSDPNKTSRTPEERGEEGGGSEKRDSSVRSGSRRDESGVASQSPNVSEPGPHGKEEIPTRKKQFVIREDQDRALNRALASESCEYGDNRSDVIQALLDLHGFHE
jgi:hypothetical protein